MFLRDSPAHFFFFLGGHSVEMLFVADLALEHNTSPSYLKTGEHAHTLQTRVCAQTCTFILGVRHPSTTHSSHLPAHAPPKKKLFVTNFHNFCAHALTNQTDTTRGSFWPLPSDR